jgi:hypothetical protein
VRDAGALTHRLCRRAALLALAGALLGACAGEPAAERATATTSQRPGAAQSTGVKVAGSLAQAADRVRAAQRTGGAGDLSSLSDEFVHVRADGAIEVDIHARSVVTPEQRAELSRLGANVIGTAVTPTAPGVGPSSIVQAWVPPDRLADVAALDWVGALTPPSYGRAGG